MADQPEVIQKELEETRHDLAEKLEKIGEKISGTVETVTETVSSVTETVSHVTEAVEGTVQTVAETVSGSVEAVKETVASSVEAVKETVASVGETASETVEAVKQAFNLSEQIRRRPWLWVGGSVVLGFVGGKIFAPRTSHTREASSFIQGHGYYEEPAEQTFQPGPRFERSSGNGKSESAAEATSTGSSTMSALGNFLQSFGPEINRLKELAIGTLFGVVRDMVGRSLPETMKGQVEHLINDFTEKAGGKPIEGPIMSEEAQGASQDAGQQAEQPQQGGEADAGRSSGAGGKKSKAVAGRSNR
jgi:ElaB/YqjD/DUF883 family membrane-anchored ribosome-binding protein